VVVRRDPTVVRHDPMVVHHAQTTGALVADLVHDLVHLGVVDLDQR
jgi:hypothetical protein